MVANRPDGAATKVVYTRNRPRGIASWHWPRCVNTVDSGAVLGRRAALAARFSAWIETATSLALVGFGLWVAIGAWREIAHDHGHKHTQDAKAGSRMALLLILGSSPMIEGIPAFFAAGQYGLGLLIIMALVFAAATIATYIVLSVDSAKGLDQFRFGQFEQYGEIVSGMLIAVVGAVFWFWPVT